MKRTPLAVALGVLLTGSVRAQVQDALPLRLSTTLTPPARALLGAPGATLLRAQTLRGRPELELVAEGDVEFRRDGLLLRTDSLVYDQALDLATARGHVRVSRDGAVYSGPELKLQVQRFEGYFLQPDYQFVRTLAGGHAERIDFLDASRSVATNATYTSCTRDGSGTPDWLLSTKRVTMDFAANEGIAEGAVLRFLGVPILALPTMSFPLTDARKSGWLPPSINLDNRSGFEVGVPYYWNIAPNYDATITPRLATRRGPGVQLEARYLEPSFAGTVGVDSTPHDNVAGRARYGLTWRHDSTLLPRTQFTANLERVSDDDWWKDFPSSHVAITPRLLPLDMQLTRNFGQGPLDLAVYARLQHWQVLQTTESPMVVPYQRSPQVGVRARSKLGNGFEWAAESEVNRFSLSDATASASRPTGWRWHALGELSRPWRESGWWVVPKLQFNAASYATDQELTNGHRTASRAIPSLSIDTGLELERDTDWWGRALRQTLEPRLYYLNTPYRAQTDLPNFDASGKDFNVASIYSENAFSGVDRVSDAHQLTAGVSTRLLDATTGEEAFRVTLAQRYLFRDQRITPEGTTYTQRLSDALLLGSSNVLPHLNLDAAVQYSPDIGRAVRSIVGLRYSPAPFQTVNASYRLARGLSEQMDLGWQWPVYRGDPAAKTGCVGTLYGVGRLNYSLRDSRVTDSVLGVEYDSGCWIARVVAERLSTGRSEATTRLLLQLELVGLSQLGSNPLKVLKDNIPGYRLLREDRKDTAPSPTYE